MKPYENRNCFLKTPQLPCLYTPLCVYVCIVIMRIICEGNAEPRRRTNSLQLKNRERINIQSTLVISKSKGPSKTVRDIRTSTYQICSIEKKQFEQPIFTNDYVI